MAASKEGHGSRANNNDDDNHDIESVARTRTFGGGPLLFLFHCAKLFAEQKNHCGRDDRNGVVETLSRYWSVWTVRCCCQVLLVAAATSGTCPCWLLPLCFGQQSKGRSRHFVLVVVMEGGENEFTEVVGRQRREGIRHRPSRGRHTLMCSNSHVD